MTFLYKLWDLVFVFCLPFCPFGSISTNWCGSKRKRKSSHQFHFIFFHFLFLPTFVPCQIPPKWGPFGKAQKTNQRQPTLGNQHKPKTKLLTRSKTIKNPSKRHPNQRPYRTTHLPTGGALELSKVRRSAARPRERLASI